MRYEDIKDFEQRCEEHQDHQSGMITSQMLEDRLQEEIDELRAFIEARHQVGDHRSYAGITIWGGDATVTKCFTQIQIEQARSPRALVEFAVQECLNELAAHGIKVEA
jgi:hypothetical protein